MVPVASAPSISTAPPVGSSNPAMMLKIVLLPQPDGPIRLTKRPVAIDSVIGASAWNAPPGVAKAMLTSSTSSFGSGMRAPARPVRHKVPTLLRLYRKCRASSHQPSRVQASIRSRFLRAAHSGESSQLHNFAAPGVAFGRPLGSQHSGAGVLVEPLVVVGHQDRDILFGFGDVLEPAHLRHHRRHILLHPRRRLPLELANIVHDPGGIDA